MIKFGTSGWRAIIADEFTFAAVRRVTQAIANHLQEKAAGGSLRLRGGAPLIDEWLSAAAVRPPDADADDLLRHSRAPCERRDQLHGQS